jgi:imidazolonepropionase-like amidohydrolase
VGIVLLKNARDFDGVSDDCPQGLQVLIEGGMIREVSWGRSLRPGLIDAHIHAYASDVNVQKIDLPGDPYRTAHAARMLGRLVRRDKPRWASEGNPSGAGSMGAAGHTVTRMVSGPATTLLTATGITGRGIRK